MSKRSSRRPKGAQRPARAGGAKRRSAGPNPKVLAAQLVTAYAGLNDEQDPLQLEMVAGALAAPGLAVWWRGEGAQPAAPILSLLEYVGDKQLATDAYALVRALAAISSSDPEAMQHVDRASSKLRFLGARPGKAASIVGAAVPVRTYLQYDCWGDQINVHVEFAWAGDPDRATHTLTVLVDSHLASIKDAFFASPLDELLVVIDERLDELPGERMVMRVEECSLATAARILDDAMVWTRETLGNDVADDDAYEMLPIVEARATTLVAAAEAAGGGIDARAAAWHETPSELDELDAEQLRARFEASEQFAAEQAAGANSESAGVIAAWATDAWAWPASFGPAAPELLAFEYLVGIVDDTNREALRTGLAPALRAWAAFTHDVLGLPAEALGIVNETIAALEPAIDALLDGNDAGPAGGDGFAARIAAAMEEAGIDFGDQDQVAGFMRAFNEDLSFEERGRILGLE